MIGKTKVVFGLLLASFMLILSMGIISATYYCEFEFTKVADKDSVQPGDFLGYEIYLENIGTGRCTGGGVRIQEHYDPFTSYVVSSPIPTSGNNVWNFGTMMPGDSKTVIVDVQVSNNAECGSVIDNKVCVWANELDDWECVHEYTDVECLPECGDGIKEGTEECDDGNTNNWDECSNDCKTTICEFEFTKVADKSVVHPGDFLEYEIYLENIGTGRCTGGGVRMQEYYDPFTSFIGSNPFPISGNDIWNFGIMMPGDSKTVIVDVEVSNEAQCGSVIDNKVCVWANELAGWECIYEYTDVECLPKCGNNIKETGEECDLGPLNGVSCNPLYGDTCDWCNDQCQWETETGEYCGDTICGAEESCSLCEEDCGVCPPEPSCGDGTQNQPSEQCDDGDTDNWDECSNDCKTTSCEFEFTKIADKDSVQPGDSLGYEIYLENIGTGRCTGGGVRIQEYYDPFTSFISSNPFPTSGNDIWNFGIMMPGDSKTVIIDVEVSLDAQCESTLNNTICVWANELADWECISETTEVECLPKCGNGDREGSEECDDGLFNGFLCWAGYGTSCTYCSDSCDIITITNYCGDNLLQSCEECDDGNLINGDGCSDICENEVIPVCGDEIINQANETCDDGNIIDGDGCSSECLIEEFCGDEICGIDEDCSICELDCGVCPSESECGNGIKEAGEECDDGDTESGDGCSSTCQDEENHRKKPIVLNVCSPNWECSGWSGCVGEVMTRNCVDTNDCEIQYNEPYETSSCDIVKQSKEPINNNLFWLFIGVILLILLLIVLVNLFRE